MLKKKGIAFALAVALVFGGVTGVAADPQLKDNSQIQKAEEIRQSEGDTIPLDAGKEDGEESGATQSDAGKEDGEESGDTQTDTGKEGGEDSENPQMADEEEGGEKDGLSANENQLPYILQENRQLDSSSMKKGSASVMSGPVLRSVSSYYAGYQVRLDGNLDTNGDLAGLTFSLYEKEPGGAWEFVTSRQSEYSSYYRLSYVYFQYFQVEGSPVNEYKVVMSDNASYSMPETVVQLDPNSMAQYGSTIDGNYLNLTAKEVPKDSTGIRLSLGSPVWSGAGTADDPYTWSVTVDRFTEEITVRTENTQASILWNGTSFTGEITEELPYDESLWEFSVKSSDGTKESFYQINVTREKYTPLAPKNLTAVSPSVVGGNDGKIQGLDTSQLYEYCSEEEKTNGTGYHPVEAGAAEISGLKAGKYYVRFQETWEYEPSYDKVITISDPVLHKITLPPENIPAGVEILECPENMAEGHEFTLSFRLPKNHLLKQVSYSRKSGSITISSSLPKNEFEYTQDGDSTIVTISHMAFTGDITLQISLLEDEYYQVQTFSQNGQMGDERGDIVLSGEESVQGGIRYFKQGTLSVTVNLSQDWKGYAKISSLRAVRRGTEEEISGTLTQTSEEQWTLEIGLDEDIDIYYDFQSYPADFTALNQIVEKIGDLDQYVDDNALDTIKARLALLSAYQTQPMKNQAMVDGYVTLLEEGYQDLTLRQNMSEDGDVIISMDEWEHVYDGNPWAPEITVTYGESMLTEGTDYRVIYPEDMVSPGTKEIVIEFIGRYIGQQTVTASIVRYYTITASAGNNGSISPEGSVKVKEGENQLFRIFPDEGYHILTVYVNGKEVFLQNINEYTFSNVSADAEITAVFEQDKPDSGKDSKPEGTSGTGTSSTGNSLRGTADTTVSKTQSAVARTADESQPMPFIAGLLIGLAVICGSLKFRKSGKY